VRIVGILDRERIVLGQEHIRENGAREGDKARMINTEWKRGKTGRLVQKL